MKHKNAANQLLDVMEELTSQIAGARAKMAADSNGSIDSDYSSSHSVTEVDMDDKSIGQHEASLRKITIDKMAHKRLGNEIIDLLEDGQVSLNAILAKIDADGVTLDPVDANWDTFRMSPLSADESGDGPSRSSLRRVMRSALKHKAFGDSMSDELSAIASDINSLIDEIQAKN
jgi:hypothetical protein